MLALYRGQMRGRLVPAQPSANAPLDAVAAVNHQSRRLAPALVNYSVDSDIQLKLDCGVAKIPCQGRVWRINGPNLEAINVPGQPETITTVALPPVALGQPFTLPAHSITVVVAEE